MSTTASIIYIPHGGGPLPLLGDNNHKSMVDFLTALPNKIPRPDAILMISAHWEAEKPTVTGGALPELIYDYYGFPPEAYEIEYPAPGQPEFAREIFQRLLDAGFDAAIDQQRGFDHGMFVPLKLMYPQADIPCIQLSLVRGLEPKTHIEIGKALSSLNKKNILVLGSGMSFHNLQQLLSRGASGIKQSEEFTDWLINTLATDNYNQEVREQKLAHWHTAPHARYCHPREEHLLPLHVCFGMASKKCKKSHCVISRTYYGKRCC